MSAEGTRGEEGKRRPTMDKLVRDLVPEQLAAKGVTAPASRYDDAAFLEALRAKLVEEGVEYYAARDDAEAVAELADLMEVVLALAAMHGADEAALQEVRQAKLAASGGFTERFRLVMDD